jgi:hypothetical protein
VLEHPLALIYLFVYFLLDNCDCTGLPKCLRATTFNLKPSARSSARHVLNLRIFMANQVRQLSWLQITE